MNFSTKQILDKYEELYGKKKADKFRSHLSGSKHTRRLIDESIIKRVRPTAYDFVATVFSHLRYAILKGDDLLVASLYVFNIWKNRYENEIEVVSEFIFQEIVDTIVKEVELKTVNHSIPIIESLKQDERIDKSTEAHPEETVKKDNQKDFPSVKILKTDKEKKSLHVNYRKKLNLFLVLLSYTYNETKGGSFYTAKLDVAESLMNKYIENVDFTKHKMVRNTISEIRDNDQQSLFLFFNPYDELKKLILIMTTEVIITGKEPSIYSVKLLNDFHRKSGVYKSNYFRYLDSISDRINSQKYKLIYDLAEEDNDSNYVEYPSSQRLEYASHNYID